MNFPKRITNMDYSDYEDISRRIKNDEKLAVIYCKSCFNVPMEMAQEIVSNIRDGKISMKKPIDPWENISDAQLAQANMLLEKWYLVEGTVDEKIYIYNLAKELPEILNLDKS